MRARGRDREWVAISAALGSEWAAGRGGPPRAAQRRALHAGVGRYTDLNTRLGAPMDEFERRRTGAASSCAAWAASRSLAVRAAELALERCRPARRSGDRSGAMGVACGSSIGSTPDIKDFAAMLLTGDSPADSTRIRTCA